MAKQTQYAARTDVPTSQSRSEIEQELRALGARKQAFFHDDETGEVVIMFERASDRDASSVRRYRISLPLPAYDPKVYGYTPSRHLPRTKSQALAEWDRDCRARWRALAEYIKMLRVSYQTGIVQIEEALLYATVVPETGETVGEWARGALVDAYAGGVLPPLLPGAGETSRE